MRIQCQKNVFYINLDSQILTGYTETTIRKTGNETEISYHANHLDIEGIHAVDGSITAECKYEKGEGTLKVAIPEEITGSTVVIRIMYRPSIENPYVCWYRPVNEKDKHKELMIHTDGFSHVFMPHNGVETDFEMLYVTPNTGDVKIVSPGCLYAIKESKDIIISSFKIRCEPKHLFFAVGTYDQIDIFSDNSQQKIFIKSGVQCCNDVITDIRNTLKYIDSFIKTKALETVNVLFTMTDCDLCVGMNVIILPLRFLSNSRDIEMAYELRKKLCYAFSRQVMGFIPLNKTDSWIVEGFTGYLCDYAVRNLFGANEFFYFYQKDKEYVIENDITEPPLFYTSRADTEYESRFFKMKSKMVVHCMEAQLSKAFIQKIAAEIVEQSRKARECSAGEAAGKPQTKKEEEVVRSTDKGKCFTILLIGIIKEITGKNLQQFFDFYVFYPGLLKIKIVSQIDRKRNSISFRMTQKPTSLITGCNKKWNWTINVKSYEMEGTFNHKISHDGENVIYYHTRPKKRRKEEEEEESMSLLYLRVDPDRECLFDIQLEQPDYMFMEQLSEKKVIGQLEALRALRIKPTLVLCEMLEKLLDNSHVFYKIKIEIIYLIRDIKLEEYDGFQHLIQYFIRTRCVPNSTIVKGNEFGLVQYFVQKHLVAAIARVNENEWYQARDRYIHEDPRVLGHGRSIFEGMNENQENYLKEDKNDPLRARTATAISFLRNILKFNDNTLSNYDDSYYIATIVDSLSLLSILHYQLTSDQTVFQSVLNEIERLRILDMVFVSGGNIVTQTCILALLRMGFNDLVQINHTSLKTLSLYPNLCSIRFLAIEGLLIISNEPLSDVLSPGISPFVFEKILKICFQLLCSGIEMRIEERCIETLKKLSEKFSDHKKIADLIVCILEMRDNKQLSISEYNKKRVQEIDMVKEEAVRSSILNLIRPNKMICIGNSIELKKAVFANYGLVRIPCYVRKAQSTAVKSEMKIQVRYKNYVPKCVGYLRFSLPFSSSVISEDLSLTLVRKIREHHSSAYLDSFIKKSSKSDFFSWEPLPLSKIESSMIASSMADDTVDGETKEDAKEYFYKPGRDVIAYREMERSFIFVLSYTSYNGKMYFASKVLFNLLERLSFQYFPIPKYACKMTQELRHRSAEILEDLMSDPEFVDFVNPVDYSELRSYIDIVRTPICLLDVKKLLETCSSFDVFVFSLEMICRNCLYFNSFKSEIAKRARLLSDKVDEFKMAVVNSENSVMVESKKVLQEILMEYKQFAEINADECKSWGDVFKELDLVKKKYSRYSANGKLCSTALKEIKSKIQSWFLVDGSKLLCVY